MKSIYIQKNEKDKKGNHLFHLCYRKETRVHMFLFNFLLFYVGGKNCDIYLFVFNEKILFELMFSFIYIFFIF